jgi:N-acetylmuramoyl-L-alanine amidase
MFLETEQEKGYPATVKIEEEESFLVVQISLKAAWGTLASPDLCGFYDEFGRNVERAFAKTQTKQPAPSSQKVLEAEKKSSLPTPSPPPPPPLSSSPPPAVTQKTSPLPVSRGEVIWVYVNLREGPGIQYKVIGKAYRKETFEILAENPAWLRVRLENGTEGWMSKKAASGSSMTPSPQSPPASSQDSSKTGSSSKPPSPI